MQKLLSGAQRLNWALALAFALIAAFIFRAGYQEIAATLWFASLILVLPVMRPQG